MVDTNRAERMPVVFVGHGSPMNAIEDNRFSRGWAALGERLPRPRAIVCISAHWETRGTFVTAMDDPETIHDFGGFPDELFAVQYPAPGSRLLASEVQKRVTTRPLGLDEKWGLDHGCWSVLKRMYPAADVPVVQVSLDRALSEPAQYDLARQLAPLRDEGILIVGSGNLVHNLGLVDWSAADFNAPNGFDWAVEANETFKKLIDERRHDQLVGYKSLGRAVQLAVPTREHYLPALWALALQAEDEVVSYFNDQAVAGSLTMTSFVIDDKPWFGA
jgi:4,5-DOPA dioxygenase extradiol